MSVIASDVLKKINGGKHVDENGVTWYTQKELEDDMKKGIWTGGYVDSMGYVGLDLTCAGSYSGGEDMSTSEIRHTADTDPIIDLMTIAVSFIPQSAGSALGYTFTNAQYSSHISQTLDIIDANNWQLDDFYCISSSEYYPNNNPSFPIGSSYGINTFKFIHKETNQIVHEFSVTF